MNLKKFRRFILDKSFRNRKKILITIVIILLFLYMSKKCNKICEMSIKQPNINNINDYYCETFDVVYTWVNGSDINFIDSIRKYNLHYDPSRFDDKNELKYSLRSLEKYASWINHIYILTNGQIPYWLDLSNTKITIIEHKKISPYPEYLPTFSSSSIETFLHYIPNLSNHFIYLNDDIFLGDYLYPEDFYTLGNGVKIYNEWHVPDCANDCPWAYIGDNTCDQHCNIKNCQYDGGDCKYEDENSLKKNHHHENSIEYKLQPETQILYYDLPKLNNHHIKKPLEITKNVSNINRKILNNLNLKSYRKIRDVSTTFRDEIKKQNVTDSNQLKTFVQSFNEQLKTKQKLINDNHSNTKETYQQTKDIFTHSLIKTNMLLNLKYGFKARHVLAHVGFLLNRQILFEMQKKFNKEIKKTAANKFRNKKDLQFAFLYYNYIMSETRNLTIGEIFDEFDTDKSETWSDREIRTFLARIYKLPLHWGAVKYFEEVVTNCSQNLSKEEFEFKYSTVLYERYEDSNIPTVSKTLVKKCPILIDALISNFGQRSRYKFHLNRKRGMHSNFMMLISNVTDVIESLDKLRRNPKKFNCINDNLEPQFPDENELVKHLLEDFYLSLFPLPSSYELPDNYRNRFTYLEDFENWKNEKSITILIGYIFTIILIGFVMKFCCLHKTKFVRRYVQML